MRIHTHLPGLALLMALTVPFLTAQDAPSSNSPIKISAAKKVFLDDQIRAPKIAGKARAELLRWGRFELVESSSQADLVLVLSADPYQGGNVAVSGGQTGSVGSNGQIEMDAAPNYNKLSPTRYAYLTVVDPRHNEKLWEASHAWGGLLTGYDSVGVRLVKKLEKEIY